MSIQHEGTDILSTNHRGYITRYYVLAVFSFLCLVQALAWVTFSPITEEAKTWYGLTDDEITLMPSYSPMCFVVLTLPFIWFLQKLGLKLVGISGAWILAIGCSIRCFIPYLPQATTWIWVMHVGHIFIGYVGIPVMILPPKISSVWFKPKERTFATAVMISSQALGLGLGFIINPYITQMYGIRTMLIVQSELSVCVALLFTIYFPSNPPTAPSLSAEEDRTSFRSSFKKLITNPSYLMLVVSGGLINGVNSGFQSVMTIILNPTIGFNDNVEVHSINEFFSSTSWLGATFFLVGTLVSQLIGMFADRFQRRFKLILLALIGISAASLLWFSLSIYGWGSSNPINLFFSYAICSVLIFSSMPIYYEAAIEVTYPIAEGTSSGLLTLSINIGCLLFAVIGMCGVFSDKDPGKAKAMAWADTGAAVISLILVILYRENYRRLNTDDTEGIVTDRKSAESTPLLSPKAKTPEKT